MSVASRADSLYFDYVVIQVYPNTIICEDWTDAGSKVENELHKLPRSMFADSEVFRAMFSLPPGPGVVEEGSDDAHPLLLDSITLNEFRSFAKAAGAQYV
jgi:hypothetical protein